MPTAYPAHREADVALRDGSTVHVRPARPDDREALLEFLRELSPESRRFRFFSPEVNLSSAAEWASAVDYDDRYGLIATGGKHHRIVGHAGYERADGDRAEVAFEIADEYQGRGLGTILLAHLAEAAQEKGAEIFEATVLPDNYKMVEVFRESGFAPRIRSKPDVVAVEFPTTISDEALERFDERDRTAAVAAIRDFLEPSSVAVIGASRERAEAGATAARMQGEIALKAVAPTLLHKTDVGAVEPALTGERDVEAAAERMAERVQQAGHQLRGLLVQQMAPSGVEMLVGVVHDPLFGPVVACGAGGVEAELLKDVAVRITPLTDRDVRQMITSLRTFPLLDGFRGAPKADVGALEDVVLRVGALVENHPEIAEMDCNPVIVSPDGALVVDASIRVEEVAPPRPEPALGKP